MADFTKMPIEAYALPSSTYVQDDSHCFVVAKDDRNMCWANCGGNYYDWRTHTLVASDNAYKEWLLNFCPYGPNPWCGITFGTNGVCHTYANRELLVTENGPDAKKAAKDYVCVTFFGKYGYGLPQLKKMLTDSYNNVTKSYSDPYKALQPVLSRVDNYLDDEMAAWRQFTIDYLQVPFDDIMNRNKSGGTAVFKQRLQALVDERENAYANYLAGGSSGDFKREVKALIMKHMDNYLQFLKDIGYITQTDKNTYIQNMENFFAKFIRTVNRQVASIQTCGRLNFNVVNEI